MIFQNNYYINAKNVLIYYPKCHEINFLALLSDDKCFYLPKVNGSDMVVCPYKCGDILKKSDFNVEEPCSKPVCAEVIDLAIVPALAIDKNNIRLGYGGGFYDRFLKDLNCLKIVCISSKFVLKTVFAEKHDIKIDKIICK